VELLAGKSGSLSADFDSPADTTIVARLKAGDLQAFETIVRRSSGRLLATARRLLANDHDAQDAVQETFISAFNSIGTFRGDARLSTWLHRIVVNAALVQLRHRRRWPEVPIHDLLPRFEADGEPPNTSRAREIHGCRYGAVSPGYRQSIARSWFCAPSRNSIPARLGKCWEST
jgi:DNA-directed RNA polymerase specialized sigma24 family protein